MCPLSFTVSLDAGLILLAKDHGLVFDDEALDYISLAAESRIRSLLSTAIAAQSHRVSSSHFREPPLQQTSSSSSVPAKAMWSHRVTSDANAVLDALSRANKDAEQSFRASRMDRLAKETEISRARERAEKAAEDSETVGSSSPAKESPTATNGAPVFGAVREQKGTKKAGKKAARDVSAEMQHKMSNATAMGMFQKKQYSWLNSVPNVSSPLTGKKRKAGKAGGADEGMDPHEGDYVVGVGAGAGSGGGPEKAKRNIKGKGTEGDQPDGPTLQGTDEDERPAKRTRSGLLLSAPTRRMVVVGRNERGEEKKAQDDCAVTMVDLLFAMERDGMGKGLGTVDEIVRRAWAIGKL